MRLHGALGSTNTVALGLALAVASSVQLTPREAGAVTQSPVLPNTVPANNCKCTAPGVTSSAPITPFAHPEIVLIFWEDATSGPVWSQNHDTKGNPPPESYGQWIGAALSLVNTPYFAGLAQYGPPDTNGGDNGGEITPPRLSPMAPIWNTTAPDGATTANFVKSDLQGIIQAEILLGQVPGVPQPLDEMLYVVIPPPNTGAQDCSNGMPNGFFGCNDTGGSVNYQGRPYVRIVVPAGGGGQTLAHEVTEPIAGWAGAVMTGCTCNGVTSQAQGVGICDWCGGLQETQNGVTVQGYWSQLDQTCIIPEAWGNLQVSHGLGYPFGETRPAPAGLDFSRVRRG